MNNVDWKKLLNKCFGKEKDERAHAIAMLAIYGFFLLILIIIIRIGGTDTIENQPNQKPSPTSTPTVTSTPQPSDNNNEPDIGNFDINYSYIYTVQNNDIKEVFTGKRLDDKEIFTVINSQGSKDYAKLSDNYLIKENGEYHLIDSPSANLVYTGMDKIISLTEKGTLTRNNNTYNYVIPTSEVMKIYNPNNLEAIDINLTDQITITVENDVIKTIDINYNNYHNIMNKSTTSQLIIKMEFNNVGTTENFEVTISN